MTRDSIHHKIQLSGSILGIESCHIATDQSSVRVGSALDADLVVMDPLVPPMAFVVRRTARSDDAARPLWVIEAHPRARVFVNDRLVTRETMVFGDTIATGCHRFVFTDVDTVPRNWKSITVVSDLYSALLKEVPLPPGYLSAGPWHQHLLRLRRAWMWTAALAAIFILMLFITPRPPQFESIQPPLTVTVLADRVTMPAPNAVRALGNVKRQTFTPAQAPTTRELIDVHPMDSTPLDVEPLKTQGVTPLAPPPRVEMAALALEHMTPVDSRDKNPGLVEISRDRKLPAGAVGRRLTVAEANDRVMDLGIFQVKNDDASLRQSVAPVETSGMSPADLQRPVSGGNLQGGGKTATLALLGALKPSPLAYEKQGGVQIPIARLPGKLTEMEVHGTDTSIALDGMVTDTEIAMCWKSGQFRANVSGNPPPYGDPATYCYVGKADRDGQQHLYISFVCKDPDVGRILNAYNNVWRATPTITQDDSVEIFLDFNSDRRDYNQLIVNTSGKYWGQYCPSYMADGSGSQWDPKPKIKTTISRESGRWTCEVMIPFNQIGGVPPKGTRWAVNFCRNYRGQTGPAHNLQNWFLTYEANTPTGVADYFHNPSRFGVFQW